MLENILRRRGDERSHLSPAGGVVIQGVHPALEGHWGQGPVHGLLPHQPEGGGGEAGGGGGVERGRGCGGHHGDGVRLRALSFHGLVLAAGGRGRGLQRGLSFHLGLQLEVVVGHSSQPRISRVTIGCKILLIRYLGENVQYLVTS